VCRSHQQISRPSSIRNRSLLKCILRRADGCVLFFFLRMILTVLELSLSFAVPHKHHIDSFVLYARGTDQVCWVRNSLLLLASLTSQYDSTASNKIDMFLRPLSPRRDGIMYQYISLFPTDYLSAAVTNSSPDRSLPLLWITFCSLGPKLFHNQRLPSSLHTSHMNAPLSSPLAPLARGSKCHISL